MDRRTAGRKSRRTHRAEELTSPPAPGGIFRGARRQARAAAPQFSPMRARGCQGVPELSLMLPGIAAHCDPDFCGDLACNAPPPEMQMSNRTAKFVSAIFASLLAGVPLTTISHSAVPAADECLSGPKKAETPPGGHWYYRVDRATKRHCWFLAEERGKPARGARPNSSPAAKPASPVAETALQDSIADAHAELTARSVIEAPNRDGALATAMPANIAVREDNRDAKTPGAETNRSVFASRWPQQSTASPSVDSTPNSDDPGTSVNSTEQTQPPSLLTAQFAAADISSQASSYSVPKLLATIIGALALAGLAVSVVFRFGRTRRPAPRSVRERRSVNWENANIDRRRSSAYPGTDVSSRRPVARDLDRAGDPNDRIAHFFLHLRAPT
jgi:hypothetical protein